MAIDTSVPRSRRALLAGGVGGVAAVVASALGRPLPAKAGTDGDVVLGAGNTATTTTAISNFTTANTAFAANCSNGYAIRGTTSANEKAGVYGVSNVASGVGVSGTNTASGAYGSLGGSDGVTGHSKTGEGVFGSSDSGCGVNGESDKGYGVRGHSWEGNGVSGESAGAAGVLGSSVTGIGVFGEAHTGWSPAIKGFHTLNGTGVCGYSSYGGDNDPAPLAKTGVYGYAVQDAASRGVTGQTTAGRGVYGQATSGVGLYGYATTGYALRTSGRLRVDKASGVATILAGNTAQLVTPGLDVTSTSFVLLTPKGDLGTRRIWYTTSPTANTFAIRVSAAVTADLKVGWLLLG